MLNIKEQKSDQKYHNLGIQDVEFGILQLQGMEI